ncbi:MAG: DUF349 domain-containing protein [Anaerolineales bacterium]|nr:MAG: DUF349 domain-containing protein [Anaerolineales bacterium]
MSINEIITAVLIFLGAVVMFLSVLGMKQVLQLLADSRYIRRWQILLSLTIFFLVGYLAALALVLTGMMDPLAMLTGLIFFFGAMFVLLVVWLGHLTIDDLIKTTVSKEQLKQVVQQRTEELITAIEKLEQEITDRKRVEKALRELEEKWRSLGLVQE